MHGRSHGRDLSNPDSAQTKGFDLYSTYYLVLTTHQVRYTSAYYVIAVVGTLDSVQ